MQMKKIIGILLAMCFVLSVTAAAASAQGFEKKDFKPDFKDKKDFKPDFKDKKDFKPDFKDKKDVKKFNHYNKGKWVPGHYEVKKVKKVVYKNHKKFVIVEKIKVWVPGHWVQFNYNHR